MNSLLDLYVQDVLSIVALFVRIEDRSFDDLREIVFDFDVFLTFEPSVEPDEEFGGEIRERWSRCWWTRWRRERRGVVCRCL